MTTDAPRPLSRSDDGKWLGGVSVGLARGRGVPVALIRIAFLVATLIGGLGLLAYLACWLIIPHENEQRGDPASRWIVVLAQVCAGCVGIAVLAVIAAAATLFGLGWIVAALAAVVLVGVLVAWPRLGPAWALLPIAALIVPSVAVAASGLRLSTQTDAISVAPRALSTGTTPVTYRGGLGTMLVDLRNTSLPASGVVRLRIEGGLRRTIVALPADRCVRVAVDYQIRPFVAQLAAQLTNRQEPYSAVTVFGEVKPGLSGQAARSEGGAGPMLVIDFTSAGGGLYVRDYPRSVDPDGQPDWPGYQVFVERRPDTKGVTKRYARIMVRTWRARRRAELRSRRLIDSLMPGPCGTRAGAR
jgi:phage shock protein PspC (stress-responsive transcriptional regulator)